MNESIKELYNYRELLYVLTWREIHVRYKQSIMGFLWAIMMPMLIVIAGVLVKYGVSRISGQPFTTRDFVSVSLKSVPWAFFVSSIRFSSSSLIGNSNLVTKIYFPKEIFPISAVLSNFFDFVVASVPLTVIVILAGVHGSVYLLWVPVFVLSLVLFTAALSFFVSAASLFFRDVKYIVEVILMFAIFFTPVFYDVSILGKWSSVFMLNPVAPILEGLNRCVVFQRAPDLGWFLYSVSVSLVLFVSTYVFFKKVEPMFTEYI